MASPASPPAVAPPSDRQVHRPLAFCAAMVATLVAAAPALAQRGWQSPPTTTVSSIVSSIESSKPAVDADGAVTAVWVEGAIFSFTVKAARRAPGGEWAAPVALSFPQTAADASVAAGPDNGAVAVWTGDGGVFVSRVAGVQGAWSPQQLLASRTSAREPLVAVDGAGNVLVVWYLDGLNRVEAIRYDASSTTWSAVRDLGAGSRPKLVMDGNGNALAVWVEPTTPPQALKSAAFSAGTGLWSAPVTVATADLVASFSVGLNDAGLAAAAWMSMDGSFTSVHLEVAIGQPITGAWNAPLTLWSRPFSLVAGLAVVSVDDDDALVVWTTDTGLLYSRYDARTGLGGWSAPAALWSAGRVIDLDLVADDVGGTFAVWQAADGLARGSRYDRGTQTWPTATTLSLAGLAVRHPQVAVAPGGTATVAWGATLGSIAAVQSIRWDGTLYPAAASGVTAAAGTLSIAIEQPIAPTLPAFEARNVEYSVDDGHTWITRTPASMASPLVIGGLTDHVTYPVRLRTVNAAGPGEASPAFPMIPGAGSMAPSNLEVTESRGGVVTLRWTAPEAGAVPEEYVVEGGLSPGQTLAVFRLSGAVRTHTLSLAPGVYYARVRASAFGATSAASNEVRITVGAALPPSAPASLLGLVNGSSLALSWTNTFDGGEPTGLVLAVSGPVSGTIPLARTEMVQFAGVPDGAYTVQVIATNAAGASVPSNAVTLTLPGACTGAPETPANLIAERTGSTLTVSWSPPATGAAVTQYRLDVTGAYAGSLPLAVRSLTATVGSGAYTLRIAAENPCGSSAASAPLTVVVP